MATETDKVNTGALATLTIVGTAATVAIALAVTALVRSEAHGVVAERSVAGDAEVKKLREEQLNKLNAPYAWSDRAKGTVALPIDRAMEVVVSDLQKDPRKATPFQPAAADAGTDAAPTTDAGAAEGDAGAAEADAAAPEGTKPDEGQPKPEENKPEEPKEGEKPKPKPGGMLGSAPVAPKAPAPAAPAPAPAPAAPPQ